MLYRLAGMLLLGATALANSVGAQSPPTPAAITRTVVAATKLPTVTEVPLYFRAVSVTLPPGETSSASAANGILYQMSGSTEIVADDQARTLNPGEGSFIAAGKQVMLKAGSGVSSTFPHFVLAPATDLNRSAETAPSLGCSPVLHSGRGANTVDGNTEAKGPGSLIYEPFELVHQ